jgi:N-acetylneuraminic acid mutarotase
VQAYKRALIVLCALLLAANAVAQGKWVKLAPFPEPAEELLGASANGKLYVFCGLAPGWKPISMVYEYDPAADKWTKRRPMPLASHHVSFTEHQGKIYAFGGFVLPQSGPPAWVPIDNAWEYDPASDHWRALAPLPTRRGSPVAVSVGDKIYVIGGAGTLPGADAVHPARPHYSVSAVEEYDPAANTWRARAPIPTPRNHAVAGVVNSKIYVIGGRVGGAFVSSGSSNVGVVEEYDPAADRWGAPKARMPSARSAMAAGVYGGRIYVAGGEVQNERYSAAFRSLESYDPVANRWDILPSLPGAVHGNAVAFIGNKLHTVSGKMEGGGAPDMAGTEHPYATASHNVLEIPAASGSN